MYDKLPISHIDYDILKLKSTLKSKPACLSKGGPYASGECFLLNRSLLSSCN